jgi:hypothetical protein
LEWVFEGVARIMMTDLHSRTRHWAKSWKQSYKCGDHYLSNAVFTGTENKITNIPCHNLRSTGDVCVAVLNCQPGSWQYFTFFIIHKGTWRRGGGSCSSFLFLQATCLPQCKLFWSGSECPWHTAVTVDKDGIRNAVCPRLRPGNAVP